MTIMNKARIHEIIFEADTRMGKLFDVALLVAILFSVLIVMLESVPQLGAKYGLYFLIAEWILTILFTIEYILRLYVVQRPAKYATSFFGVIDLMAILPTYLSLILPGSQYLIAVRSLRLLRVFRIFRLVNYLRGSRTILFALRQSRHKIQVFLFAILVVVIVMGSIMYVVEGQQNDGFDNIPRSIYWAIITLTTVGYGDITPITPLGQMLASIIMILGYAIIAVPTGIVSSEIMKYENLKNITSEACPHCMTEGHLNGAKYCYTCGEKLNEKS